MTIDCNQRIDRLSTESAKWGVYGKDVLPMWVADMDFVSPEPVIQALRERVEHGVFGYPMLDPTLPDLIVDRMTRNYGWKITPEDVQMVPGVVVGVNMTAHATMEPGDGYLVQTPVYYPFFFVSDNTRTVQQEMELTLLNDGRYEIDYDAFEDALDERSKLFILCNPHNPVGKVFRRDELERMAEICLRHDMIICSDEIHCDLIFKGEQHIPMASLDSEIAKKTITLIAPSKTYNVAGLKASIAIVQDEELREKFCEAKQGLVGGVNLMGQLAMKTAYSEGQEWLNDVLAYLEANRDFTFDFVNEELPGVRMAKPEGTYLAWLDCRGSIAADDPSKFFLEKARVGMNPGKNFGKGGAGFVRLNFGCPRSMLEEALEKMKRVLVEGNDRESG